MNKSTNLLFLLLVCAVGALAQDLPATTDKLLPHPSVTGKAPASQVFVNTVIYLVPNSRRTEVMRRFPELLGLKSDSSGKASVAGLAANSTTSEARLTNLMNAAKQRGLIEILSRPSGVVADGQTLDISVGQKITTLPVQGRADNGKRGAKRNGPMEVEVVKSLKVRPVVTSRDNAPAIEMEIELRMDEADYTTGLSGPAINRQSIATTITLREGEAGILGGLSSGTGSMKGSAFMVVRGHASPISPPPTVRR